MRRKKVVIQSRLFLPYRQRFLRSNRIQKHHLLLDARQAVLVCAKAAVQRLVLVALELVLAHALAHVLVVARQLVLAVAKLDVPVVLAHVLAHVLAVAQLDVQAVAKLDVQAVQAVVRELAR